MGQDPRAANLARAIRAHLEWDAGELLGVPELDPAAVAKAAPGPVAERAASRPEAPERTPAHMPADAPASPPARGPAAAQVSTPEPTLSSTSTRGGESAARVRLEQLETEVRTCTLCELAKARTQTVFARGNPAADLVFVGEGPGRDEDQQGLPFVGAAGKLLDKMIGAMGRGPEDIYICNVVKCRPPQNRTPLPDEAGACRPYLEGQIDAVAPKVIVALGRCAADNLGCVPPTGGRWRGRWGNYRGVPVMPTYHPAFLLRSPEFKRPVWEDLQQVMKRLG